jgi:hypothetical protein
VSQLLFSAIGKLVINIRLQLTDIGLLIIAWKLRNNSEQLALISFRRDPSAATLIPVFGGGKRNAPIVGCAAWDGVCRGEGGG